MAKSLFLILSILPLLLSLTSTLAQLLQSATVPSAACSNLNIIPGLSAAALPALICPYQAISSCYIAAPRAPPYVYSNLAAISPYGACSLASLPQCSSGYLPKWFRQLGLPLLLPQCSSCYLPIWCRQLGLPSLISSPVFQLLSPHMVHAAWPHGAYGLASPYLFPNVAAAISPIGAYNVPTIAASPAVNALLLNQLHSRPTNS